MPYLRAFSDLVNFVMGNKKSAPSKSIVRRNKMSALNRKYAANVTGTINIEDGKIMIEVEDVDKPVDLAAFIADFDGKNAKISVSYSEELDGE